VWNLSGLTVYAPCDLQQDYLEYLRDSGTAISFISIKLSQLQLR